MEPADYLRSVESDARGLLAASWSDPMRSVPTCPDWTLSDLAAHMAGALHWAETLVRTRAADFAAIPRRPEGWEDVSAWFEQGLSSFLETLGGTDPDAPVWNWVVMGPGPARFWYRRVAHEASIHRWDAENAVHPPGPIDAALALDGIDEYLMIASRGLELAPRPGLGGSLGLETTDGAFRATARLAPDGLEGHEGLEGANCVVRAEATDLLLWLVGRKGLVDEGIAVEGDVSVAAQWAEVGFG